ncbi:MAG: glycoside hydrolase family 95 protein [Akkermansia sp.]|nr:glycoside hydrolase family 95 protein [Akkermansia sp.]
MNKERYSTIIALVAAGTASAANNPPTAEYLWYKQPAEVPTITLPFTTPGNIESKKPTAPASTPDTWESQTLPVGNGRIGGTIYGGDRLDCVNLNEVSLWSGGMNEPKNGAGYAYGPTSGQEQFGSFQPFGNLMVAYSIPGETENYNRALDLPHGAAYTSFTANGTRHMRECFVSKSDDVLVYAAKADKKGELTMDIALTPYHNVTYSVEGNTIIMSGTLANGQKFEGRAMVVANGGKVSAEGNAGDTPVTYTHPAKKKDKMMPEFKADNIPYIHVKNADSVTVYVALATDYRMDYKANWKSDISPADANKTTLAKLKGKKLKKIRKAHQKEFGNLYTRMSINLGKTPEAVAKLPTDERLAHYRKTGEPDPELEATIYQYGRYVLISGSRPGNLPVNLQGIWNNKVHAPWASDYHNNINLQMCYWGAEVANLSECHKPLIDFIRAMEEPLTEMTRKQFGDKVRGWTTRISQNPWGGGGWIKWNPPVNAWYALHIWDHYLFTQDKQYLKEVAYPLLKNICHFWEDELKEVGAEGQGLKTTGPKGALLDLTAADHPELKEIKAGSLVCPMGWSHEWGPVEDGCAHDQQLIWELFDNTIQAAEILGVDADWAKELTDKRDRLVGNRIGRDGYLQEWIVDRPDKVAGQRHTSHLIGVYPGTSISMAKTPELAKAAMKSLELRGLSGDNRRSWTWPWRTALWARFGHTENAYSMVQHYIRYNLLENLLGNHPPMQMDGTFGMTGGMSEMLIQSHAGRIELLPTLPEAWHTGAIKGIRARGGLTVDMKWKDGKITQYRIYKPGATKAEPVTVIVNGKAEKVTPETTR